MLLPYPSLRQGLVGAWCPSLGASGLTLIDRSGRNNHGTLVNMAGQDNWRASGSGIALNFDGTDDRVATPLVPITNPRISYSIWVYPRVLNVYQKVFSSYTSNNIAFELIVDAGGNRFLPVGIGNTSYQVSAIVNRWHHLAVSIEGSFASAYLNGSLSVSSAITSIGQPTPALVIGARSNGTFRFNGLVDDFRIYNRSLTPAEIRLLASRRGIGLTPSAPLYDGDDESLKYPIVAPPNRVHANVDGVWVPGQVRANEAGVWQRGDTKVNNAGVWSPPFDPRSIPGLQAWYDAADSASITLDSGRVSQWSDKSGNARHATNTTSGSTQPSYTTAGRNGLNVLSFAAASVQRLAVAGAGTFKFLHDGTDSFFVAVSVYGTSSNLDAALGLFGNNAASTTTVGSIYFFDDRSSGSRNNGIGFLTSNGVGGQPPTNFIQLDIVTPQTMVIQEALVDANNATGLSRFRLRLNGGSEITQSTVTFTPTAANATHSMQIGAVGNNEFPMQGDICELMFFNEQPTAADRTIIRQHLAAKWGVTLA